jgi:hypothetical protein
MTTLSHRSLVASARAEIRKLKKPVGMRSDLWPTTQQLLSVLAGFLPEVWPSQRTLAAKLGCSQPSIHRRVSTAMRFGLLTTVVHSNPGWLDGKEYLLTCLSEGLKADCSRYASRYGSVSQVVLSLSEKESSPLPSGGVHGSAASRLADQTPKEAGMPRHDPYAGDPDPLGGDPEAPYPSFKVKAVDPATTLALQFDQKWYAMARRKGLRGIRPSDRGMAIGYLRGVMLTQVDPDVALEYMTAFIGAVRDEEVEIKTGQFAFEKFTKWWGRIEVDDPVTTAEDKARAAAAVEKYREYLKRVDDAAE